MKVAVIGSRGFSDYSKLEKDLERLEGVQLIISGGAKGADQLAEKYAESRGIPIQVIKPDYKAHKQGAPIRRNEKIVQEADQVIAFWDGKSKGTKHVIEFAEKLNKGLSINRF